jgi:hypothetical protein
VSKKRWKCSVLIQGEEEVFKRYGSDEAKVKEELSKFLSESYGHVFQIRTVEQDKTKTL